MVKRIESLTDEQRATLGGWCEKWMAHGLRTGQLTEEEWLAVEAAARKVAAYSDLPEPIVIRSGSPLAAQVAAPVALEIALESRRNRTDPNLAPTVGSDVARGVVSGDRSGITSGGEVVRRGLDRAKGWTSSYRGGNLWASHYAYLSWFRDIGELELDGDLWDRFSADEALATAGPQSWHREGDLCVVAISDRPIEIHRDAQGQSHREDGPAIVYADAWKINMWHGLHVPNDFFEWDIEAALRQNNAEIRRAGIERIGWENLTDRLSLVATAPDPGNDPFDVSLYDLPSDMQLYAEEARLLIVHNASLDKGGERRTFGLPVPLHHSDPLSAAADLFGVPREVYTAIGRAT